MYTDQVCELESVHTKHWIQSALILDFFVSRTLKNKCLLLKLSNLQSFVLAAKAKAHGEYVQIHQGLLDFVILYYAIPQQQNTVYTITVLQYTLHHRLRKRAECQRRLSGLMELSAEDMNRRQPHKRLLKNPQTMRMIRNKQAVGLDMLLPQIKMVVTNKEMGCAF